MWTTDDGRRTDGRTTEHGYTISSPCEPDGSGELKTKGSFNTSFLTLFPKIRFSLKSVTMRGHTLVGFYTELLLSVEFYPCENQPRNCKQWPKKSSSLIQVKKNVFAFLSLNNSHNEMSDVLLK